MKLIDLSYPISDGMFRYPGPYHPDVRVEQTGSYERDKCEVRKLTLGTHTGTHVDAPRHFDPKGKTIDKIPLEMLVAEAEVFDVTHRRPGEEIGLCDLEPKRLKEGDIALLRTDWSAYWGGDFYKNPPRLAVEAAQALLEAGAVALGVDFPLDHDVHHAVLGRGRLLIENLVNLDQIPSKRCRLFALPLKVEGADGAPARVVAVVE
jgi:kynurenine formamidase